MTEVRAGQSVTLTVQWYAILGGPAADVTGQTITISPTGGGAAVIGPTAVGITHEATGLYSYSWAVDAGADLGDYVVLWEADGPVQSSEVVTVTAAYGTLYATLAKLKKQLGIPDASTEHDDDLTDRLEAASRGVDDFTGRRFWLLADAAARTINPKRRTIVEDDGERLLLPWDIGSLDGLVVEIGSGSSWTAVTDYETYPDGALDEDKPIEGLLRTSGTWRSMPTSRVRVTARWGYPILPAVVTDATLLQAARLWSRRQSPTGVLGNAEFGLIRVARVDPDVAALVASLERKAVG